MATFIVKKKYTTNPSKIRRCLNCGASIEHKRPDAIYCCPGCKEAKHQRPDAFYSCEGKSYRGIHAYIS